MKTKNVYYVLFLIVLLAGVTVYFKIDRDMKSENPEITDLALEPDILINSADRYHHDHKRLTAIEFLEDAIETMKLLERSGDSVSNKAMDIAIHDLEVVEKHILEDDIDDDLMYEAFADAMNSMAYASLRISEEYIQQGRQEEADITMEHAMAHLQNSIKYARGEQKAEEIKLVSQLAEIMENHLTDDLSRIDAVMQEIDSVVKAHVIE